MTDNDIIKALECCKEATAVGCKNCPLYEDKGHTCITILSHNALDLINRKDDIIDSLIAGQETLQKCIAERMAEIKILQEKSVADDKLLNDRVQEAVNSVSKANQKYVDALEKAFNEKVAELKTAKTKAYREFAERLKEKYDKPLFYLGSYEQFMSEVDNLVKEMTEVSENG